MRFNDLTQTILAVEERTGGAAITLWRQCIDMLAQYDQPGKVRLEQEDRVALVSRLSDLRPSLDEGQRIASVVELGSRLRSPALIEFFASDRPAICAVAMSRAQLPDVLWPVLLSRIGPTARGVLRGRRDIGERTRRALQAFGATDLVLAAPASQADAGNAEGETNKSIRDRLASAASLALVQESVASREVAAPASTEEVVTGKGERSQIKQLVDRIERFTATPRGAGSFRLPDLDNADAGGGPKEAVPASFPFETDVDGQIMWVGEASRTALVGLNIAQPALPGETGPDGYVAGAFARRTSFQNGRMFIGEGAYIGEWRVSAIAFFDPSTGRFRGYRGQARRPFPHEMPRSQATSVTQRQQTPTFDSMRQIVHELRTPLNAILGFAEIIEKQLFGPAEDHYREMAGNILSDAKRLMTVFDDIDLAARSAVIAEEAVATGNDDAVNVKQLIANVIALYNEGQGDSSSAIRIECTTSSDLPLARVDGLQVERMIQHLVRTLVSVAVDGEVLRSALWAQPGGKAGCLVIGFNRPRRLMGLTEKEILDPGYGTDGEWPDGPLLGLGFSMRLVRSLVQGQGGALIMDKDRFLIELPVARNVAGHEAG